VHVQSGLGEDEGASVGDKGTLVLGAGAKRDLTPLGSVLGGSSGSVKSAGHFEEAGGVDEGVFVSRNGILSTESMDSIG